MKPTTLANIRRGEPYDTLIDRRTKWGNPFRINKHCTRQQSIAKYHAWIRTQPQLLAALPELQGKRLGCWCAPLPCHGHVLARLADAQKATLP